MNNKVFIVVLLIPVVLVSASLYPPNVAGQSSAESSAGEIRVAPAEVSLEEGETQTIAINYDSLSTKNPEGIEFIVEYNPDVISVLDVSDGGYLPGEPTSIATESGRIGYGKLNQESTNKDTGTVATITIELADGVSQDDTTDLTFTRAKTIGTEGSPKTVDGTVEAVESTDKDPQDKYNVQVVNSTLSPSSVDSSSKDHTLSFDMTDISADGERDNITVSLPDSVVVEDVASTTVTNANGEVVRLDNDPATLPNPGNEINFAVNPLAATDTQRLDVELKLTLSTTS